MMSTEMVKLTSTLQITKTTKVNSECYMKLLDERLLPDVRRMYPNKDYVFQQDETTSHTRRATHSYLEDSTPRFIKKDECPPPRPISKLQFHGLQCTGLAFRESLQRKNEFFKEDKLKDAIRQKWREIPQDEV